ncbi:DNA topoisomerase 1 KNAG_0E00860 [Huiozyma naganishii CBS 8797]|uniref:DNA topoisomerase I n=1 Tax=Huiozyma naganishii (strain ATCC MYA-139 / BCRC 22969 / CBS 8797 / KCTC 17520 / NBRC 10181 / NCYC 3082 / Yp74L-3) TaxID=1071383 RepID=J7S6F4_HUIN7|nr:hypothetical protein KNAG_0E00860 [Kazachstania naganishii CBS 8797]CCK70354.1 hypothetical protein KNAG_0E00860 [Kazachstania naganishii CBS 8797]
MTTGTWNGKESSSDSASDENLSLKRRAENKASRAVLMDSSEEDIPLSQKTTRKKHKKHKKRKLKKEEKEEETKPSYDSDENLSALPRKKVKTVKREESSSGSPDESAVKREKDEEAEAEAAAEYKWWEEQNNDDSIKWTTLKHNGVMFPPDYQPLPSHVKLYYDRKPVDLPLPAEEVAGFYAALLGTQHAENTIFQKNFFQDFLQILRENGGALNGINIVLFDKCDFSKIHGYLEQKKEEKRQLSAQERKQLRQAKAEEEEPYKFCELDGRREQVGNFRVEPPDLFRGRGAHPKTGKLKRRVYPEDIMLNLSKDAPIPPAPEGHHWGEIRHDNAVQWLAMWRENIFGSFKYVRLAANSSLKGQSDFKKFEKARELKKYIDSIRRDYRKNLKSKVMLERQKAVALYLIDVFALRAGGEKSEDEADTVGCCSLRYEHVTLRPPKTVIFDFLGKDSIRFYQEVEVDKQVFKNLTIFKRPPKQPGHQLFDRLDPSLLNKHLQNYMPGLTAKVFRTYNASKTMQDQLDLIPNEGTVAEKLLRYNAANRAVAILCNHQRTVTKSHAQSVEKAVQRIEELTWQKIRLKRTILQLEPSERKSDPTFFAEIDTLTREQEEAIHKRVLGRERAKYEKKFARENEKRQFDGGEPLPPSTLTEWLEKVDQMGQEFATELETGLVATKPSLNTVEKLQKQVQKLEERIKTATVQLRDKEENSEVSLGTSKINYIDPRLSVVFCKKYGVPIEKVFTKSLREKFKWATESVDAEWRF